MEKYGISPKEGTAAKAAAMGTADEKSAADSEAALACKPGLRDEDSPKHAGAILEAALRRKG